MLFDIPVIFDDAYHSFITENRNFIHSVYFGLPTKIGLDARNVINILGAEEFVAFLDLIPREISRHVTLNTRYTPPHRYSNENMRPVVDLLRKLHESGNLTGILVLDFFYLQRLADTDHDLIKKLDVVPSINCMLDSIDKINAVREYLNNLNCGPASKIILDRSLNRRYPELQEIIRYCRAEFPDAAIELIANEGCLYQCPYKINHDIFISLKGDLTLDNYLYMAKVSSQKESGEQLITERKACIKYYAASPDRMLKSPFIRPEDIDRYDADIIKISGRARTMDFMKRAFFAYKNRAYTGNLIRLMDAMYEMSHRYYIKNEVLPDDFWHTTAHCDRECERCGYCSEVFDYCAEKLND